MFCSQCGKPAEDGKSFCNYCGARLAPMEPPAPSAPQPPAQPSTQPPVEPEPPPPPQPPAQPPAQPSGQWVPPPPPPPPPPAGQPAAWGPDTQAAWDGPPQSPPPKKKGGWIAAAIAGIVVVAAAIIAASFLIGGDDGKPTTETSSVVTGTVSTESTPPPTSDSTAPPVDTSAYIRSLDELDAALQAADARSVDLDEQVDATAPDVPDAVHAEFQALQSTVEDRREDLGQTQPPPEYQEADQLIFTAADLMEYRLEQTMYGIEAMWNSGTVEAGTTYFDEGRSAQDQYQQTRAQYETARP